MSRRHIPHTKHTRGTLSSGFGREGGIPGLVIALPRGHQSGKRVQRHKCSAPGKACTSTRKSDTREAGIERYPGAAACTHLRRQSSDTTGNLRPKAPQMYRHERRLYCGEPPSVPERDTHLDSNGNYWPGATGAPTVPEAWAGWVIAQLIYGDRQEWATRHSQWKVLPHDDASSTGLSTLFQLCCGISTLSLYGALRNSGLRSHTNVRPKTPSRSQSACQPRTASQRPRRPTVMGKASICLL